MYCDDLRKILPVYKEIYYAKGNCTIHEPSLESKVKEITWYNADFQVLSTDIAKDLTRFFQSAKSGDIFCFNCDGVFLFQGDRKKYMFLCELKSTFDSSDVYHACNQITSTYIKLSMILNLLPNFNMDDVIVKGFIISRPPLNSYLRDLYKQSMFGNNKKKFTTEAEFCLNLCYNNSEQSFMMKFKQCHQFKDIPLGSETIVDGIEFHHISVEEPNTSITVDVMQYAS